MLNFPTAPTDGTYYPTQPAPSPFQWKYKSATPAYWRDVRGTAQRTNRMPNPAFQISQINELTDGTNISMYMADSWYNQFTSDIASVRFQRVASPTPKGGGYRLRATVNTADTTPAAGEWLRLELPPRRHLHARPPVGYGVGGAGHRALWLAFTGGHLHAGDQERQRRPHLPVPFTISAGQANTDVELMTIVPGDTTGTWPAGAVRSSLWYWSIMNVNTTSSGNINKWVAGNYLAASGNQSNGLGVAGAVFEFFDVGVYADPLRTGIPPDFEIPNAAEELTRMQRYIQKCHSLKGIVTAATVAERCGTTLAVPMRTAPALSVYGSPSLWDGSAGPYITSITGNYSSKTHIDCQLTCAAGGLTPQRPALGYLYTNNSIYNCILAKCDL